MPLDEDVDADAPVTALRLTLPTRLDAVTSLLDRVERFVQQAALPDSAGYDLMLSLEELFSNVVKYGHPGGADADRHVEIEVIKSDDEIQATVIDDGIPFDPWSEAPAVNLELPPEERPIGGLGLHLVRSVMDEVSYERRGPRNRVTVHRRIARGR